MLVAGLLDAGLVNLDAGLGAVGKAARRVKDLRALTGDDGPVAFLQIGDAVGHRGKCDGVRPHIHLTRAMADGQGAALAGGDHQILLAIEQEAQGKGAVQPGDGFARGLDRGQALIHQHPQGQGDGLGIGFRFRVKARRLDRRTQLAEVLDDAVMHHGHGARAVGVGVHRGRRAMGGPAGVADAGFAGEGIVDQKVRKVDQLAHRAAAVQFAPVHRCNARAVIAAIFQPLQRLDDQRCNFVIAQDPNNSAHFTALLPLRP